MKSDEIMVVCQHLGGSCLNLQIAGVSKTEFELQMVETVYKTFMYFTFSFISMVLDTL